MGTVIPILAMCRETGGFGSERGLSQSCAEGLPGRHGQTVGKGGHGCVCFLCAALGSDAALIGFGPGKGAYEFMSFTGACRVRSYRIGTASKAQRYRSPSATTQSRSYWSMPIMALRRRAYSRSKRLPMYRSLASPAFQ